MKSKTLIFFFFFSVCPLNQSNQRYMGPEVDIWSMGVTLYVLLCGRLPFQDPVPRNMYNKIIAGQFTCPADLSECTNK